MRRMYTAKEFRSMIEAIRAVRPDANITTDVIVGFPGETDQEFQETLQFVKEIGFSHVHTFKYSLRDGTRAARMEDHIPEKIKTQRSELIRIQAEENKKNYRSSLIGSIQRVIIEKEGNSWSSGTGDHLVTVKMKGRYPKNTWQEVKVIGIEEGHDPSLLGEPLIR